MKSGLYDIPIFSKSTNVIIGVPFFY